MPHFCSLSLPLAMASASILFSGCSQAPTPIDTRKADEAAIRAAGDALAQAAITKSLDKSMSFYVDDPVLFIPGAPAVVGKDAVRKAFQAFLNVQTLKLETSDLIIDVAASGDLAMERGSYTNTITDATGKTTTETGKLVLVWKKQADGS